MTLSKFSLVSSMTAIHASSIGISVDFDILTERGPGRQLKIVMRAIGAINGGRSAAVFGTDREVEPFGAPDHLEDGVADRFVAREEPVQVVHARDGLLAQA